MKFLYKFFLLVIFYQPLYSSSYLDSLDTLIDQKVTALVGSSCMIEGIVHKIKAQTKQQISLQDADRFLSYNNSIAFIFCHGMHLKLKELPADKTVQVQQDFQDLKFALGAKLYLYYLECCQLKIVYHAMQNYEALQFWRNEKFYEEQPFFQKNIVRYASRSQYKQTIEKNIAQLQKLSQDTHYFLGLVQHSKYSLQQATTYAEFERNLMIAVKLQEDYVQLADQNYESSDIADLIKKSIHEAYQWDVYSSERYAQCQLPSHLKRNWQSYTLSAVGVCACAFIYLNYGNQIMHGSQNFWNEHARSPVERMLNTLTGVASHPQLNIEKDQEMLQASILAASKSPVALDNQYTVFESLIINLNNCSQDEVAHVYEQFQDKIKKMNDSADSAVEIVGVAENFVQEILEFKQDVLQIKDKYANRSLNEIVAELSKKWNIPLKDILTSDERVVMTFEDIAKMTKSATPSFEDALNMLKTYFWKDPKTEETNITKNEPSKNEPSAVESSSNNVEPQSNNEPSVVDSLAHADVPQKNHEVSGPIHTRIEKYVANATDLRKNLPSNMDKYKSQEVPDYSCFSPEELDNAIFKNDTKVLAFQERNPMSVPGAYNRMALRELIDVKVQVNKFSKDLHMVLGLTALIPIMTVIGGSFFASKTLYNSVAYQPVRNFVRQIEVLLNESLYQPLSFDRQGHLYFLTEQLKLNISVLTISEQKIIDTDISDLQSQVLDYAQKFNVVQRMYRTYPCLLPGAV